MGLGRIPIHVLGEFYSNILILRNNMDLSMSQGNLFVVIMDAGVSRHIDET